MEIKIDKKQKSSKSSSKNKICFLNTNFDFDLYEDRIKWYPLISIPHFVIKKNGEIVQWLDAKNISHLTYNTIVNTQIIFVALENEGILTKVNGHYFTNTGHTYKGEIFSKKWKGQNNFAVYPKTQFDATLFLTKKLLVEYKLKNTVTDHSVFIDNIQSIEGVCYRGNINRLYYDLSPSWDYKGFKKQLL
jgi:hypothetical protein